MDAIEREFVGEVNGRRKARVRRAWFVAPITALLVVGYCAYQPAQQLGAVNGRPIALFKLTPVSIAVVDRDGRARRDDYLAVGFWIDSLALRAAVVGTRHVATAVLPYATAHGFERVEFEPSTPLFLRRFPLTIRSIVVRYTWDPERGYWIESARKADSVRAVSGPTVAADDTLARELIRRMCLRDSSGTTLLSAELRREIGSWRDFAESMFPPSESCGGLVTLMSVAAEPDRSGFERRLSYQIKAAASATFLNVWFDTATSPRLVSTVQVLR